MKKIFLSWVLFSFFIGSLDSQNHQLRPMTVDDSLNMVRLRSVQMSPDGKWVFFSKSELDWERNKRTTKYYMIPASGGEAKLYVGEAGGSAFQFSPDGKYLSFKRSADKTQQIFIMSLSGGEAIQLTHHKNDVESYKWSPDASQIFFTAEEPMSEEEKKEYDLGDDAILTMKGRMGERRSLGRIYGYSIFPQGKRPKSRMRNSSSMDLISLLMENMSCSRQRNWRMIIISS